ncbi:MAG TPA: ATP-binding cassette domain-containing protein [Vicinamibacterales bacterium]|nr:ATP-binding cassette domain-containing protein [Vicinamibacterales bacterium]
MIDLLFEITATQGEFSLDVGERSRVEVLGLFGPSGAGKTTILELIAGLRTPTGGAIAIAHRPLFDSARGINLPPRRRRIGYVPQDVLLFPHLDVRGNLLYGVPSAAGQGVTSLAKAPPLHGVAAMLEIEALLDRRVHNLSGGERQRVAIGRALMTAPMLLLLDEPLAAVDRARRERILPYLLRIRRELHVPLIYVTHDASELAEIADRVLVVGEGRVVGAGPPAEVLHTH